MKKISAWFRRIMVGRHGTDKLNMAILVAGAVLCVVSLLVPVANISMLLVLLSYGLLILAMFRCFSRNTYKRYQENRRFSLFLEKLTDRQHKYFNCPRCRQPVRVPRKKGKIAITCPKCKEKFVRKT